MKIKTKLTAALASAALAMGVGIATAPAANAANTWGWNIVVWKDKKYRADAGDMGEGYLPVLPTSWPASISSFNVGTNVKYARVHSQVFYGGNSKVFYYGTADLSLHFQCTLCYTWDNAIKSIY